MSVRVAFFRLFAGFTLVMLCLFARDAWAEETAVPSVEAKVETVEMTPKGPVAPPNVDVDATLTVMLEGESSAASVLVNEDGQHYLDAAPILAALDNEVDFDGVENVLTVRRSQDGVVMKLYTDTGLVQANGKDLGRLKHFGDVAEGRVILTPNALSILSGLIPKFDEDTGVYELELDPRLKVATGFDILVQDIPLINVVPEPKAVGPVLLLPLRPIADELGHDVQVSDGVVTVRRAQDSALFTLELDTGLTKLRGRALGVVRDMAYADTANLLLPSNAVETLTGTHISVSGQNIEIVLDDRLDGAVEAGRSIGEVVSETPFTPESLTFRLGPQQTNSVAADFRVRGMNGRVRYEVPDLPDTVDELEPSWLSLDFAHVSGVTGSLGDAAADRRQLDGVGVTRIRGLTAAKTLDDGRLSAAIGVPTKGTVQISDDQSRLTYGGFAAGTRWQDKDGWEAGLALRRDNVTDDQFAVLSAISKRHNLSDEVEWTGEADLGVFDGPSRERAVDGRFAIAGQARTSDVTQVDAFLRYEGVEFLRTDLAREAVDEEITRALTEGEFEEDDEIIPDIRRESLDRINAGLGFRYTPQDSALLKNPAIAVRMDEQRTGLGLDEGERLTRGTVSFGAGVAETGVNVALDGSMFRRSGDRTDRGYTVGANVYKSFEKLTLRGSVFHAETDQGGSRDAATISATVQNRTFNLSKGATLSVSPSASASYVDGNSFARAGLVAGFNSGALFGEKNRVGASFGVLQSVSQRGQMRTSEFLSINAARRLRIGDNMALGVGYNTDLGGNHRIGLTLDGRFDFNARQRLRTTKEGRGILSGQAFLDENRDGIRQDSERALPGVIISLEGTPYRLRADANGAFTVQNLKQGIYNVRVLGETLPLGFAQSEDSKSRASIADGRITHLEIPIVQRGQIRGFVFIDENGNGTYDRGEERPEGKTLILKGRDEDYTVRTTSFGQYAFDDLPGEDYALELNGTIVAEISLSDVTDLMGKLPIALVPTLFADTNTEDTREPAPPEPAP